MSGAYCRQFMILRGRFMHRAAVFIALCAAALSGRTYRVAQNGSGDFTSIQAAAAVLGAGDTCLIRQGTYRETVRPANSGTSGLPIVFAAYAGEKVVISGCDPVTGWHSDHGMVYRAPVSGYLAHGRSQVFFVGKATVEARFPNSAKILAAGGLSPLWPAMGPFAVTGTVGAGGPHITSPLLAGKPVDFYKGAIYVGKNGYAWTTQTADVSASGDGFLDVINTTSEWWFGSDGSGMLTGPPSLLDTAGEWCIAHDSLYLWAPGGDDPSGHAVEIKKRQLAFDLRKRSRVRIVGIDVFAASATLDSATYCAIDNCSFTYVSHYTWLDDGRDGYIDDHAQKSTGPSGAPPGRGEVGLFLGGDHNALTNSRVTYSAGASVFLSGLYDTIANCVLDESGYAGTYVSGIFISYDNSLGADNVNSRGGHIIANNRISNTARAAVHWTSRLGGGSPRTGYAACVLSRNEIFNTMLLTTDGGCIYGWNVDGNSTQISYNWVHDNFAALSGAGIYLDDGCANFIVHHNVVWKCMEGMRLGHIDAATGHRIYNNTFWNLSSVAMAQHGTAALTDVRVYNNLSDHNEFIGTDLQRNIHATTDQFIDSKAGDFRLAAGSVAIDTGIVVPGITAGIIGRAPDAGAYEFGGDAWTAGTNSARSGLQRPPAAQSPASFPPAQATFMIFDTRGRIAGATSVSLRALPEPAIKSRIPAAFKLRAGIYYCEIIGSGRGKLVWRGITIVHQR